MSQKCEGLFRSKHEFHCITQLNVCWQHKEMERRKGSFVRQCHDSSTQSDHEERSCTIGNRWRWRCGRSGAWRVNKQKIRETEREPQVENERQRWAHTLTVEIVSRVSTLWWHDGGLTKIPRTQWWNSWELLSTTTFCGSTITRYLCRAPLRLKTAV